MANLDDSNESKFLKRLHFMGVFERMIAGTLNRLPNPVADTIHRLFVATSVVSVILWLTMGDFLKGKALVHFILMIIAGIVTVALVLVFYRIPTGGTITNIRREHNDTIIEHEEL